MSDAEPETEPTDDDTVDRATTLLGEPEARFRASPQRQRVKFFAGSGLLLFGIAANVLWFGFGLGFQHALIHFQLWPPVIGGALLWHMWRYRSLRVLVYPHGLFRLQHGEPMGFPWDEIATVRCKIDPAGEPHIARDANGEITAVWTGTNAPTLQVWNVWLEVTRSDDVTAKFTSALADFSDLLGLVQRGTFPRLWAEAQSALANGERLKFGKQISVSREAISSGKLTLPWKEVKLVGMTGKLFTVKRVHSWLKTAIACDPATIPNLHVLFAIAADRGVMEVVDEEEE